MSSPSTPSTSMHPLDHDDVEMAPPRTPPNHPRSLPFAATGGVPWAPRRMRHPEPSRTRISRRSPCLTRMRSLDDRSSDSDSDDEVMQLPARRLFASASSSSTAMVEDVVDVFQSRPNSAAHSAAQQASQRQQQQICLFAPLTQQRSSQHEERPASRRRLNISSDPRRPSPPTAPSSRSRREQRGTGSNSGSSSFKLRRPHTSSAASIRTPVCGNSQTSTPPPTGLAPRLLSGSNLTRTYSEGGGGCMPSSPLRLGYLGLDRGSCLGATPAEGGHHARRATIAIV